MQPSGSVSLPSLQGGCEARLAKWLGYYSDVLIFLPWPSQRLCSGWDIGSFLTPPGGQFTQHVYPARCQGSPGCYNGLPPVNLSQPWFPPLAPILLPRLAWTLPLTAVVWSNISLNSHCLDLCGLLSLASDPLPFFRQA